MRHGWNQAMPPAQLQTTEAEQSGTKNYHFGHKVSFLMSILTPQVTHCDDSLMPFLQIQGITWIGRVSCDCCHSLSQMVGSFFGYAVYELVREEAEGPCTVRTGTGAFAFSTLPNSVFGSE